MIKEITRRTIRWIESIRNEESYARKLFAFEQLDELDLDPRFKVMDPTIGETIYISTPDGKDNFEWFCKEHLTRVANGIGIPKELLFGEK